MSIFGVILVRIFPAFSCIWTEYAEILCISPHSFRMRENPRKMWTRITPNMDAFYAVFLISAKNDISNNLIILKRVFMLHMRAICTIITIVHWESCWQWFWDKLCTILIVITVNFWFVNSHGIVKKLLPIMRLIS